MFNDMQTKTGISIPKVSQEKKTHKRSNFFGEAENTFKETQLIKSEDQRLKKINMQADKAILMEKREDFLERAEHLMKVDQFMKDDLKLDEEKKEHQKGVERYRDSLIGM